MTTALFVPGAQPTESVAVAITTITTSLTERPPRRWQRAARQADDRLKLRADRPIGTDDALIHGSVRRPNASVQAAGLSNERWLTVRARRHRLVETAMVSAETRSV